VPELAGARQEESIMKKFLTVLAVVAVVVAGGGYGLYKINNPEFEDLYSYYLSQDTVPVGKTAVFLIGLHTTEDYEPSWWYNIYQHVAHVNIPWPVRTMTLRDRGVSLVDPDQYYSQEEFEPTRLIDRHGSEYDVDKVPYIEKYRQGLVKWQPPKESRHGDTGSWVMEGRSDGTPTPAGKRMNLAKIWYYGKGIKQQKIPADYQSQRIYDIAFSMLNERYPGVPYTVSDTMDPYLWHKNIFDLLDSGVETLVLTSNMVMYSDYEDFHNGFLHSVEIVREWEAENGHDIKIIIASPMGYQKAMREGYQLILRDKLDTLPDGVSVKMVWSIHGMPWLAKPNESWLKMAPKYTEAMVAETEEIFEDYNFSRTEVMIGQDHFADHYWDPEEKGPYISTNRGYVDGVEDGFDYVLSIPIEFYNENTDTLFTHALLNYENFPGYDVYNEIDYPDWDKPYTSHFVINDTDIFYLGVPTGDRYRPYVAQALFSSIDEVLSQSE
jgi:hypothetical protein